MDLDAKTTSAMLLAASLGLFGTAANASTAALVQLGSPVEVNQFVNNPTDVVSFQLTKGGSDFMSADVLTTYGILKAHAFSQASTRTYARADASFNDGLTISNASFTGQVGYATITIGYAFLNGLTGNNVDSYSQSELAINIGATSASYLHTVASTPGCIPTPSCGTTTTDVGTLTLNGKTTSMPVGPAFQALVPFVFGQSMQVGLRLSVQALATAYLGTQISDADSFHSVYWGGLGSVTDSSGNLVDFTLIATSGTDYKKDFRPITAAVPEPSTYALMGLGLLAVVARKFKRARS